MAKQKFNKGEILDLLSSYVKTLTLLEEYDKGKLRTAKGRKAKEEKAAHLLYFTIKDHPYGRA